MISAHNGQPTKLRIGSRGSQLALWQANHISALLRERGHEVEIEIIHTTGDKITDVALAKVGTKGMFTKEIEEALAAGRVDLAVHSLKDLPTELPHGFENLIAAALEQRCASLIAQPFRIVPVTRIAQDFRAVRVGNNRVQMQLAIALFGKCAYRNLAPPAKPIQKRTFAGRSRSRAWIVQERQQFTGFLVPFADLNAQSPLSRCRAHHFGGNDLLDQFRFA